jgi:hypothetical protein
MPIAITCILAKTAARGGLPARHRLGSPGAGSRHWCRTREPVKINRCAPARGDRVRDGQVLPPSRR